MGKPDKHNYKTKKLILTISILVGIYSAAKTVARKQEEDISIDEGNPYLSKTGTVEWDKSGKLYGNHNPDPPRIYNSMVKPLLDQILSFAGLILLSPLYAIISTSIWLDDPGPVFFTQKRVGKDKRFFYLHKFRSMKMSAPHDVPTHQLEDPERYITCVGNILRKTSLDELPQIWDIFRGKMSIIGPRPALWNQEDLVSEREKYGANRIFPGLTGLAQIRGRDELEIPDKARVDGEYAKTLEKGGPDAFFQDIKCFAGTVSSVLRHEGVVEGGTGRLPREAGRLNKGAGKLDKQAVRLDKEAGRKNSSISSPIQPKRILIMGAGSYIGESVKSYLGKPDGENYMVDIVNTVGLVPAASMFHTYDVVFNAAGIAHVKETAKNRRLFYEINRDLAINIAKAAKKAGVGQFIQLSSMNVYGMTVGRIDKNTIPHPNSAYGKSKLAADEAIKDMEDGHFKAAILRPPMVYGKGCKGNYQLLRSFALKSRIFPDYKNQRSMIYIGNLCEFVKRVIDHEEHGLFLPQNQEYVSTSEMVALIGKENGKKIFATPILNPVIKLVSLNIVKKVFGDLVYENADVVSAFGFEESLRITEER